MIQYHLLTQFGFIRYRMDQPSTPGDNSELEPPLPIPNRTVKRLCADDSAATSVKVGHRQAFIRKTPSEIQMGFFFNCMF